MSQLTEEEIRQEIDDISALCADMNEEEDMSWIDQLELNNTRNSSINQSMDVSASVLQELDDNAKDNWLFPVKGFEKRDYQLNISKSALMYNTLVILPTGLGKTFIASVAIYNFMRWFPQSKIIFMAPTRPLVHQQMSACYDVVGIPKTETAEMTGKTSNKKKRKLEWESKRIFFATPQVVQSDIKEGIFPSKSIKLLVFDEAHKAKGDYAYCKVIEEIYGVNKTFRVLALTATAGKTADIIQIIQNLLISKIEHRSEGSIDVHRYTHKKSIEIVPVKLGSDLQEIYDYFIKAIDPIIKELRNTGGIQTNQISKGYLIMQRKKLIDNYSIPNYQKSSVLSNYSAAIGFYHSLEILQRHSVHLFLKSLKDDDNKTHYKFFIAKDYKLTQYVKQLEEKFDPVSPFQVNINPLPNGNIPVFPDKQINFGHPKFDILKEKLNEYFDNNGSKTIIFCEYRDTTLLIYTLLLQLRPKVMSSILIGQGGAISQKDQLQIMKNFREGKTNTLVCTSVAEEGLDVGDVDLVICYDINTKNAVRFVQRIGRTARKRNGKVIVLATEGRELSISKDLLYSKDQMNKSLTKSNNDIFKYLYKGPRLFPKDFNPQCIEMKFVIARDDEDNNNDGDENEKKPTARTRKSTKKNLGPKSSKESITNYLKPIRKKSIVIEEDDGEIKIDDDVIELDEPVATITNNENAVNSTDQVMDEFLEQYKENMKRFTEKDGLTDESYAKMYIEYTAAKKIENMLSFMEILKQPVKEEYKDFELDIGDIDMTLVKSEDQKPDVEEFDKRLKSKKNKFVPVSTHFKSPVKSIDIVPNIPNLTNIHSPLPLKFTNLRNSSTPIRVPLKPLQSLADQPCFDENSPKIPHIQNSFTFIQPSPHLINSSKNKSVHNKSINNNNGMNEPLKNKFEFLGIMSIEDIFEGVNDSHMDLDNLSKCTENVQKSPLMMQDEVVECSITEHVDKKLLSKLNLNDFNDIFEMSNQERSVGEMEKNLFLKDDDSDNDSDKTQIYDVDEELSKIELTSFIACPETNHVQSQVDSQKENDDSCLKKTDSKPNLSKLLNIINTNNTFGSINLLQEHHINSQVSPIRNFSIQSEFNTPRNQEITIRSNESTPDLPNKSIERSVSSPITSRRLIFQRSQSTGTFKSPDVRRVVTRKRKVIRNPFLQTQAGVDDNHGSSDEEEEHDITLNGFVCNETIHDQSMMHAKYLKSLQSPSARRNGRFVLRQLQPVNESDIFSQAVHEESEYSDESDMDSFIVDGDDDSVVSEVDELEIAEQMLKEKRRKRKVKQGENNKKKRKILIQHSHSSDEELRNLRNEVLANPD